MLIEFTISNFRSIQNEQILSLVASPDKDLIDRNTMMTGITAIPRLVRSALIYGPNAAGKSSLIKAIGFMKSFVMSSATKSQEGDRIDIEPFVLGDKENEYAKFEATFVSEGVRYQYGFSATTEKIVSEWLFSYPEGRPQRWFLREYDPDRNQYDWRLSAKLKGTKSIWKEATRDNALFLSAAVQLNSEQLKSPFNWFKNTLQVIEDSNSLSSAFTITNYGNVPDMKNKLLSFLNKADLSISDIKTDKKKFSTEMIPDGLPASVREHFEKKYEGHEILDPQFGHRNSRGDVVYFQESQESEGTQKLFALAGPWIDCVDNNLVLFVDELDNSLHPVITRYLMTYFNSGTHSRSQLIVTTHDTTMMDLDIFRRDQIWFVEKDKCNSTRLFPLTDFSPRKAEAVENGYLLGRYGALPYAPGSSLE